MNLLSRSQSLARLTVLGWQPWTSRFLSVCCDNSSLKALKKLVVRTFQTSVPTPISLLVIDLDDCQHSLRPAVWSSASLSQRRSIKRFPQILPDLCIYLLMSAIISGCGRDGLPRSDPAVRQILKQTFAIPSPYIPDNIDIAARLEDNNER